MVIKKCNNFIKGMSEKTQVKLAQLMTFYVSLQLMVCNAFANSNTGQIDGFIDFACDWLTKIRRNNSFSRWSNVCVADGKGRMLKENQED